MAGLPQGTQYVDELKGHGPFALDADALRPNVFLVTIDMVPPEAYRAHGYRAHMHLPSLDRLQTDSVTFGNAFCPSPLCSHSRYAPPFP